jgi:hypothetical protein
MTRSNCKKAVQPNDAPQKVSQQYQRIQKSTTLHKEKSEVYSDHTEGALEFQPQNFQALHKGNSDHTRGVLELQINLKCLRQV